MEDVKTDIKVADDVMYSIVGISASKVEGVLSLGDKISNIIGVNKNKQGVLIEKNEESITVKLEISIKQGYSIREVAVNVQEKVKEALETMLDVVVKSVNVRVIGIENEVKN